MKKSKVWKQLLEELERTPIVQVACEKVGISRQTYYRWAKDESMFSEIRQALLRGIDLVNDVAESNVLAGIKGKDPGYTKYWLSHRHEAYKKPFRHRNAVSDLFEMKRIEEHYRNLNKRDGLSEAERAKKVEEAAKKAKAMLDRWFKDDNKPPKTT